MKNLNLRKRMMVFFMVVVGVSAVAFGLIYFNAINAEANMKAITPAIEELVKSKESNISMDKDEILNDVHNAASFANNVTSIALIGGMLSIVIGFSVAFFSARSISNQFKGIVDIADTVASGDLTIQLQVYTRDEAGQLVGAMKTMVENLRSLAIHVKNNADQVAMLSMDLTESSEQSAHASTQVAESMVGVAEKAALQLDKVNSTVSIIQQISASLEEVSASSETVAEMAEQAVDRAKNGEIVSSNAVRQMFQIETSVKQTVEKVRILGEHSREIGQIVDTISNVADQTNLLALNAAIEAARAGEQGRGFAVVADEVRKLAEQSQNATQLISSIVAEIQRETQDAVVSMNEGAELFSKGTKLVTESGDSFKDIFEIVESVSRQIRDISIAVDEMAKGSEQIVDSVRDIEIMTNSTAAEAQTVSAAIEEQTASLEEIASSSNNLSDMAKDLQTAIKVFKV